MFCTGPLPREGLRPGYQKSMNEHGRGAGLTCGAAERGRFGFPPGAWGVCGCALCRAKRLTDKKEASQ